MPPGPPVLQTLVAEVYGPDPARRMAVAAQIKSIFEQTPGVVDTDWYVEAPHAKITLAVDGEKAAAAGLSPAAVAAVVRMAGSGESAGLLHDERAREDVPIVIRLPRDDRSLEAVQSIRLRGTRPVAVGELTSAVTTQEGASLYHKNLQAVTYVTGDLAGKNGSPVYAILQMNKPIGRLSLPEGYGLEVFNAVQPFDTSRYAMKWDGEWHLTIEVFRDLGLAFAAVLVLIYVLVVGWFQSFKTPLLIMAAIPFSLVGILPAHAAMGAFFTATSMIGFIAGAGIVVRNSIILVDFIELRLREGLPLEQAVVDAGAVRFRPMALTAAAMIVGAAVILFDPIFQGLAISLMAGEVASLLLSRMAVPVLYYMAKRHERTEPVPTAAPMEVMTVGDRGELAGIPALAPVPGRRHFECAPEGPVERRFRLVAHVGRDIRHSLRGRRQRLGRQTQPPARQIRDRGNREVARETLHERGAREADVRGELGNGPRVTRAAVKQREALAHDRVSCAREPPSRLIGEARDVSPHRVHEQDFRQLGEHHVAACAVRGGLLDEMQDRLLQPLPGAVGPDVHLQHGRQALENRTAEERVARQIPAHEPRSSPHRHRRASAKGPVSRPSARAQHHRSGSIQSRRSSGADPRAETARCRLATARHQARLPDIPGLSHPRRSDRSTCAARRAPASAPIRDSGASRAARGPRTPP